MPRPTLDKYFMKIAEIVATRSTCRRHKIGTVTVRDKHILTTGYNGAPAGLTDCLELGCLRDEQDIPSGQRTEICRAVHSEENAIIRSGLHGVNLNRATLYTTHSPCRRCAKMIVNSGIKTVIYMEDYGESITSDIFEEAGVEYRKI